MIPLECRGAHMRWTLVRSVAGNTPEGTEGESQKFTSSNESPVVQLQSQRGPTYRILLAARQLSIDRANAQLACGATRLKAEVGEENRGRER
jgi:hypothetical protein